MSKRKFGAIKSLLHFDYPYFNEPGDGLGDEVGLETWSKESSAALYGSVIPKAGTQAPKFGYRCLYARGAVIGTNTTGIWNLNSSGEYEIEMLVYLSAHGGTRYLFRLENAELLLLLDLTSTGELRVRVSNWGVADVTGATVVSTGAWHHVLLRVSEQKLTLFLDGAGELSADLPENVELSPTSAKIGYFSSTSYKFYIDEFVFRHSAGAKAPTVPTHPYSGSLMLDKIVGYKGFGSKTTNGTVIAANTQINSYGIITSIIDAKTFAVSAWDNGSYTPAIGGELLIHITAPKSTTDAAYPLVGLYAFAKIESIDGKLVALSREISTENGYDFTLDSSLLDTYYVQVISVPKYASLTINSGKTVTPLTWNTGKGGGIVAFRTEGDCTINGSILTHGKGAGRWDTQQMTNAKLIDRFLCSQGGGVFIVCGGTLTIGSSARLGASWSGTGDGSNGAAGYGGKGGNTYLASGGAGGVGGGGGGAIQDSSQYAYGGACGANGNPCTQGSGGGGCGGNGGAKTGTLRDGGSGGGQANSQGTGDKYNRGGLGGGNINGGSSGIVDHALSCGGGGGGPGGNGGYGRYAPTSSGSTTLSVGVAGASIILIAKTLNAQAAALSTGGSVGGSMSENYNNAGGSGGGGTGFCYIAYESQVSE